MVYVLFFPCSAAYVFPEEPWLPRKSRGGRRVLRSPCTFVMKGEKPGKRLVVRRRKRIYRDLNKSKRIRSYPSVKPRSTKQGSTPP